MSADDPVTLVDPPQPNAALVVGPEDHLVLSFHSLDLQRMDQMREQLKERWPDLVDRILFVGGGAEMAVVRTALPVPAGEARGPRPD